MSPAWTVRRYREEDREGVFELYRSLYGAARQNRWQRSFSWEYVENPWIEGPPPLWVAQSGGETIGLYGTIPVRAIWNTERIRACWSADLMTHPRFRGRGVFGALTDRAVADSCEDGITLFLVFPNRNSGPILRRRGWTDVVSFPSTVKTLRPGAALRKANFRNLPGLLGGGLSLAGRALTRFLAPRRTAAGASIGIRSAESFDGRVDGLFEEAAAGHGFIVVRSREYLNWRYAPKALRKYSVFFAEEGDDLLGYIVLAGGEGGGKGHIVDFLVRPGGLREGAMEALLEKAAAHLRRRGAESIELCAMSEPYAGALRRAGFTSLPGRYFGGYDLVGRIEGPGAGSGDFGDTATWFITRGDADSDIAAS